MIHDLIVIIVVVVVFRLRSSRGGSVSALACAIARRSSSLLAVPFAGSTLSAVPLQRVMSTVTAVGVRRVASHTAGAAFIIATVTDAAGEASRSSTRGW